jgi:hypothetical protein
MSDYSKYGRAYYLANKEAILAKEKENKRWVDYYAKNREMIAERNRRRYYEKKGLPVPEKGDRPKKPRVKPTAPDPALVSRFEQLVEELRVLAPQVVKPKKEKRAKKAPEPAAAPANTIEWAEEIVDPSAAEVAAPGQVASP